MNQWLIVGLIAIGLSFFSVIVSKLVVDEDKVKEVRERMKESQKKLKSLKPGSKEYNELQDQIIKDSMFITTESYKPMIYTTIIFMIALWWLSSNFAFAPIAVNSTIFLKVNSGFVNSTCLNISKKAPISGEYVVSSENCTVSVNGQIIRIPIGSKEVIKKKVNGSEVEIKPPKMEFIPLPFKLPFVGNKIGYFGYYLLISFPTSMILNRLLKNKRIKFPRKSP